MTLDQFPQDRFNELGLKTYSLGYLAWDIADSLCDYLAILRLASLKKEARIIRYLYRDYTSTRQALLFDSEVVATEERIALMVEEWKQTVINRHIARCRQSLTEAGITDNMALAALSSIILRATLKALTTYATAFDNELREAEVDLSHSTLLPHFRFLATSADKLYRELIPAPAGATATKAIRAISEALLRAVNALELVTTPQP